MPVLASLTIIGSPKAQAAESPVQSILNFLGTKTSVIYNQITDDPSSDKKNQDGQNKKEKKKRAPEEITDPQKVEDAAEFAAKKTGVRKDFLMGMLTVESNLGKNTGKCTYKEVEDGAQDEYQKGALSQKSWNLFEQRRDMIDGITKPLNYDYENLRVSCNPAYTGTGGAMGISQFMPEIWMYYKDSIGAIVGKDNPDPWDVRDGVVAMALLLADTQGVTDHNYYAERNAAKMYLSGTTSMAYDWYANQVAYWSQNYKSLF